MIKKTRKPIILVFLIISLVGTHIGTALTTGPIIGEVTITPAQPAPQSTVTFSVDITADSITSVRLIYKECKTGLCYESQNISMTNIIENTYTTEIALGHADSTYITYHVGVASDGTWTTTEDVNLTLSVSNGNNNANGDNKTPGFAFITFITAIGIIALLVRKKRF